MERVRLRVVGSGWAFVRILYHHRIGSKDGQAVHLEELIAALRGLGHEVHLVGPDAFARASFGHDPKLLARLKRIIPRAVYELLELGYNLLAYPRLRRACRKFRPDIIYERYNLYLLAGIWCKKAFGIPMLLEVNAPLAEERAKFGGLGLRRLAKSLEGWVWRETDFALPVTNVLADHIRASGVPDERIRIVHNAINPGDFALGIDSSPVERERNSPDKIASDGIMLGFTGFVREWHGLEAVLEAIADSECVNLHLMVVGDGPAIPQLKEQVAHLKLADRVMFAGLVERERLPQFVAAFDIALLPGCVEYCSPLKLFEYMAAGKAIVAPDQPNIREILTDDVNCVLFPPGDYGAMGAAILRLAKNRGLRARLGASARALVLARDYTWRNNAARVSSIAASAAR
jgi:glycosyltransferase involved in cell wall biosynthesis